MKTINRSSIIAVTLFLLLWMVQPASAFYAPEMQRWVNRDPLGDEPVTRRSAQIAREAIPMSVWLEAQGNLYSFCRNSPPLYVDGDGLHPVVIVGGGGVVVTIGQGVTIGMALCLVIPSCREALRKATERAIEKCRPLPREKEKDDCDAALANCIANPWQPDRGYGKRKDCRACYDECNSNGRWPSYKCAN